MPRCWSITDVTASNRVIYYPELGYVLYPTPVREALSGESWLAHAVQYHVKRIKLLALYCDKVFIPYSHLFTCVDSMHAELLLRILRNADIRVLVDSFTLFAGGWGGDRTDDLAEHQVDFLCDAGWPLAGIGPIRDAPALQDINVATRHIETQKDVLVSDVEAYAELIRGTGDIEGTPVVEAIRSSNCGQIPFVHEVFWRKLRRLPISTSGKRVVSREINRAYFRAGECGNPGVIAYAIPNAEPPIGNRAAESTQVAAVMYSPEVFKALLMCYFSREEVAAIERLSAEIILDMRGDLWHRFVASYFKVLGDVSHLLDVYGASMVSQPEEFSMVLKRKLLTTSIVDASAFIDFVGKVVSVYLKSHLSLGEVPVAEAAKVVQRPLLEWVTNAICWSRHRDMRAWFGRLRANLRRAGDA